MSRIETQRSLRWWYNKQSERRFQDAELIRDGLLQEAFTLRRTLELSLMNSPESMEKTHQELLETFERFHHDLKELSDRLSPPYLDDNLPLAIQSLLSGWQVKYPAMQVELKLPHDWQRESSEQSRLILMALDELLGISLSGATGQTCLKLHLTAQAAGNELTVQIKPLNHATRGTNLHELHHLERTLHCLMPGQCSIQHKREIIDCHLRWKSS